MSEIDLMWLNRMGAQLTKRVSTWLVPNVYQENPAFESFIWFVESTENLTLEQLIEMVKNFPSTYIKWWKGLYDESPVHIIIETAMVVWILWLLFIRRTADPKKKGGKSDTERLTDKEIKMLIKTWEPDSIVPELTEAQLNQNKQMTVVNGIGGDKNRYLDIQGIKKTVLNVSSYDYLGLSASDAVKARVGAALNKYGCGSCGPRGFYGTIDVHLQFEEAISKFMGTEEAIAYSDSASGVTSTVSAFAKRGDLLLMDEGCHEAIRTGANLSRATVRTFKHNDTNDLRSILEGIAAEDKKKRRDATQQRRFIITEGLFRNSGEICPLPSIIALKEKYHYRIMLDDSQSFGTLGKTGRGITEHYNIPVTDIEIITIAMDNVLASVGGVCIGSREVVDHQRLSGPGYCFSASACPFLSAAATTALSELEANPTLLKSLENNSKALALGGSKIKGLKIKGKEIQPESPILHLQLDPSLGYNKDECKTVIVDIARRCAALGTGVATCKFSLTDLTEFAPSIRINSNAYMTKEEINSTIANISAATTAALKAAKKK
jgi:serine palmitoyltransferase